MTSGPDAALRGVLFDVDGTLIDSTHLHAVAWWQALRYRDVDVAMSAVHRAIGMGADTLIPHLIGEVDDDEASAITAAHDANYATWWPSLRALPGASALVRRCHESGLLTVLASSAGEREVGVVRRVLDVDDVLDVVTSSDDAEQSKPSPDLVVAALQKAGLDPDEAVMIGDAVWDVHAAADAGVRCLGLECGGTSEAELRDAGAVAVYADPADLLEQFDRSLLAGHLSARHEPIRHATKESA